MVNAIFALRKLVIYYLVPFSIPSPYMAKKCFCESWLPVRKNCPEAFGEKNPWQLSYFTMTNTLGSITMLQILTTFCN